MPRNFTKIFYGPEGRKWALVAPGVPRGEHNPPGHAMRLWRALVTPGGSPEEGTTHQGAPGGLGAPWWVVPTSGAPWTASLLYKYPNILETLGESTKYSSSRRRVQNHQIQSRH